MYTLPSTPETTYQVVRATRALTETSLPGLDYSLNPYFGCEFNCSYCYARKYFLLKKMPYKWGEYVQVKGNLPTLLEKELKGISRGSVIGLGTSTDPCQPIEGYFRLTERLLKVLSSRRDVRVDIQTKAAAIYNDLNLIKEHGNVTIGFTILTLDEALAKVIEPRASVPRLRLKYLGKFADEGVESWLFIGPILPYLTDSKENLDSLIDAAVEAGVKTIYTDKLRFRLGVKKNLIETLAEPFPDVTRKYVLLNDERIDSLYIQAIKHVKERALSQGFTYRDETGKLR
jgi:DNA repair photolyase